MTLPESVAILSRSPRFLAGFSVFFTWFALWPYTAVANSTIVHGNAILVAVSCVVLLVVLGCVQALAGRRLSAGRAMRFAMAACALVATAAGVAFLLLVSPAVRIVCMIVQEAAGVALLLQWALLLSRRSIRYMFVCVLVALVVSAMFYLVVVMVAAGVGVLANRHAFSDALLAILLVLPVVSVALCGPDACYAAPAPECSVSAEAFRDASARVVLPVSYMATLCLASLITLFMGGFSYLPYAYDRTAINCLAALLELVMAAICLLFLSRRKKTALSDVNVMFLASLLLTIIGLLLLALNAETSGFVARGAMVGARDGYLALSLVLFCGIIREYRLSFFPLFMLGSACTGLQWAYFAGIGVKRMIGYDIQFLAPACTAFVSVLALAFFVSYVSSPAWLASGRNAGAALSARKGAAGVGASGAGAGASGAGAASGNAEAGSAALLATADGATALSAIGKASASDLGAQGVPAGLSMASAQRIVAQSYEEALAPFGLSPREKQVSLLVASGYTASTVADELGISLATVKFHLGNAYRKIGIQSKSELIVVARSGAQGKVVDVEELRHE